MKTPMCVIIVALATMQPASAYTPPHNLRWGMTYDEVKQTLSGVKDDKPIKLGKLEEPKKQNSFYFYPNRALLDGRKVATIENVVLLNRKIEDGWAIFDHSAGLIHYQYEFWFNSGRGEEKDFGAAWSHFQTLKEGLISKYGQPSVDEAPASETGKPLAVGVSYKTVWSDSATGEEIWAVRSYKEYNVAGLATLSVRKHSVYLLYSSKAWTQWRRSNLRNSDL